MASSDFLVIGGGVVGVNIALQAKKNLPDSSVTLIDKEAVCGEHASGRNSGVLHAGFYYTADSLNAGLTKEGNKRLTDYCLELGLVSIDAESSSLRRMLMSSRCSILPGPGRT